jgi:flagellar basal-body rod modification protein FlgD
MVDSVSSTSGTSAASAAAAAGAIGSTTSAADQANRFITLLVAQMKNQDPLNPLDNAQVTSQMAQVSTVQGIEQLNSTMTSMLTQIQGMQASNLVGHDVLLSGNSLAVTAAGTPANGGYQFDNGADSATIEIRDSLGNIVASIPQGAKDPGVQTFSWDGKVNGTSLPPGNYTFAVTGMLAGKPVQASAFTAGHVVGVIPGNDGVRLTLSSGASSLMSGVKVIL